MNNYPDINNPEEIRRFFSENPVDTLSPEEISREIDHWRITFVYEKHTHSQQNQSFGKRASKQTVRWGGITIALVGIPVAFAVWPIGLCVSLAGAGVTLYGEYSSHREDMRKEERDNKLEPIVTRREKLIARLQQLKVPKNPSP